MIEGFVTKKKKPKKRPDLSFSFAFLVSLSEYFQFITVFKQGMREQKLVTMERTTKRENAEENTKIKMIVCSSYFIYDKTTENFFIFYPCGSISFVEIMYKLKNNTSFF